MNAMAHLDARVRALLRAGDYSGLRRALEAGRPEDLAELLPGLAPLEKLACFKLMRPEAAAVVFSRLPFSERYFFLCGFPQQSMAPLLEGLSGWQRSLFHASPPALFDRMLDEMLDDKRRGIPSGGRRTSGASGDLAPLRRPPSGGRRTSGASGDLAPLRQA
ncbi:MAG: hypothetical protein HY924_15450 [Elusimicrobia bacterium]|nr:hypothetical protein [Elusimicrobiota bacterium]